MRKILNKIDKVFHGAQPTVLWTGGGYHIYQPISGFVLEEIDRFAVYIDPNKKDLTSRFLQFAEGFFTNKQNDPQHRPSVKSCLIRIPGTINSKYNQEVRIVQGWNGFRPAIQYLLRDYRTWLVAEMINDKQEEKKLLKHRSSKNFVYNKTDTISWIEKLLQTPIADHRKYAIWRILVPYLFNVRKLPDSEVISIVQVWLDKCNSVRPLDFNSKYLLKQNVRNRKKNYYLPISVRKLSSENQGLYTILHRILL